MAKQLRHPPAERTSRVQVPVRALRILITGCQRSGTTLLSLILGVHSQFELVDEMEYDSDADYSANKNWVFKLPTKATKPIPHDKMIWCERNARDTISSMVKLEISVKEETCSWALHTKGALREIENCTNCLQENELLSDSDVECMRLSVDPDDKAVLNAAICWRLKKKVSFLYSDSYLWSYDTFLSNPREELQKVCDFLDIELEKSMFEHHLHYS